MYNTRRITLEEAKTCIIDFYAKIAKACELQLAAKNRLPVQSDIPGLSGSDSELLGTEEES